MAANQVLGGAASGAAAGSAFGPWGAAAGGVLGGALGWMQDDPAAEREAAVSGYQTQMQNAMDTYQGSQGEVLSGYGELWDLPTTQAAKSA